MEPRYFFGPYCLDPQTRSLTNGGRRIDLTARVLDTLLVLVRAGGRLVTKEELLREIWSESVVEENNLSVTISKLRAALGETAQHWRYIETVARRGYRFAAPVRLEEPALPAGGPGAASTQPALPPRIAVLPLKSQPEDEYVAEGLTEALITALGRIGGIRVVSYQSVRRFRDSEAPLQEVARVLQADLVIEGALYRVSGGTRTTLRLIDGARDMLLWGQAYNRSFADTFGVSGEVAGAVARAVAVQLTPQEQGRLGISVQVEPDVFELFLRGRYLVQRNNESSIRQGHQYLQRAVERSPTYAAAHAGLSYATFLLGLFGAMSWKKAGLEGARAARSALELDPSLSEAHVSLGLIREFFAWDWAGAERAFRRAVDLSPGDLWAHLELGALLGRTGEIEAGLATLQHALSLDPVSHLALGTLAELLYYHGAYDAAIEQGRKAIELTPDAAWPRTIIGLSCLQKGLHAEGITALRHTVDKSGELAFAVGSLGYAYAVSGRREDALAMLCRLQEAEKSGQDVAVFAGLIQVGTGDEAEALRWFERAYAAHSGWIALLKADPRLRHLHSAPPFARLLEKLGLSAPRASGSAGTPAVPGQSGGLLP